MRSELDENAEGADIHNPQVFQNIVDCVCMGSKQGQNSKTGVRPAILRFPVPARSISK